MGNEELSYGKTYDVIVVGAGHAGCEAALAAARMGCSTLLLTIGLDTVAQMSCNPSIGGIGKGHLVYEVDALGGEMGLNIDATGIQFRRLNMRKGPAVRACRAQADRMAYSARMKRVIEWQENLDLKQGMVEQLVVQGGVVRGVKTREGIRFDGRSVVLTTGTFMRGLIHVGMNHYAGGRAGEPSAEKLSACLNDLGLRVGRLKTGTPARLSSRSINFEKLEKQFGDQQIRPFSFLTDHIDTEQVCCYIAHTNEETHEIIRRSLHRSPLYGGIIEGVGPRYCPSIEDKVVRFPERRSHQSFLEPEGRDGCEMYPSGLSTSLPADVQLEYFRSMVGFEQVEMMRPGYAIEYDFVEPTQLELSLETKAVGGLFHAGQINGTSGYEEAAGQGLLAGINAARQCQQKQPIVIRRDQGYLGVMVDDLVTQTMRDPYRMFTSRAEHRLLLREDNADVRLTDLGREIGLVSDDRWAKYTKKKREVEQADAQLRERRLGGSEVEDLMRDYGVVGLRAGMSGRELLKRPELDRTVLGYLGDGWEGYSEQALEQLEIGIRYEGYLKRQQEQADKLRDIEGVQLGPKINYDEIQSISTEVREKLKEIRPATLGQASRIQGITPAALAVIQVYLRKNHG